MTGPRVPRSTRLLLTLVSTGLVVTTLGACSNGTEQPSTQSTVAGTSSSSPSGSTAVAAVCADADAIRASMNRLKSAEVGQNALSVVTKELAAMQVDLRRLVADAQNAYAGQVDAVKAKASALKTNLQAAAASPSPATMSGVTGGIRALGVAVDDLVRSVADAC